MPAEVQWPSRDRGSDGEFKPGNSVARRHGLHSKGEVDRRVQEVEPKLDRASSADVSSPDRYSLAHESLSHRLAISELLVEYLNDAGVVDGKGRPRAAVGLLLEAWSQVDAGLRASGLTPASAAKLASTAADVQSQLDALRSKAAAIAAEHADVEVTDDGSDAYGLLCALVTGDDGETWGSRATDIQRRDARAVLEDDPDGARRPGSCAPGASVRPTTWRPCASR